jgi:hypothetical protein
MMSNDLANTTSALALNESPRAGLAMSFDAMKERVLAIDEFYKGVMQQGTDYDTIPGTPKADAPATRRAASGCDLRTGRQVRAIRRHHGGL